MMKNFLSILFPSLLCVSYGFQSIYSGRRQPLRARAQMAKASDPGERGDFPPEDEFSTEYSGSIDWDAEWKKVVANEGKTGGSGERPGKDFYKSEAEIAAIKAVNKVQEKASGIGTSFGDALPNVRSLSGDWKFWISILAVVSIGISVLTAPSDTATNIPTGSSTGSYYI